jgi:FkbM family methyltransferase
MLRKVQELLRKQDLREHPVRGILRRVAWRLRWWVYPSKPWLIHFQDSFPLLAVQGGSAASIYYGGASEPEIADVIRRLLRPGMVFVDVGAHLGEYTVLAAKILNNSGYVHAFEPRPDLFEILRQNIELNHCQNAKAQPNAVWCKNDSFDFEMTPEPAVSALRPDGVTGSGTTYIKVRAVTLDEWFSRPSVPKPNLIKVDVEGAELQVLQGAASLLTLPQPEAPSLIFEYSPENSKRFGYSSSEILVLLRELGYTTYTFLDFKLARLEGLPTLPEGSTTCNLVAVKAAQSILL